MRKLTHEETLAWIAGHHAWRTARKSKPIWARAVLPDEVGKEFQTADHAVERATADHWLCVGVASEPYSPRGGYVVTDWADDPYRSDPKDVWLVQQELFESTYELAP